MLKVSKKMHKEKKQIKCKVSEIAYKQRFNSHSRIFAFILVILSQSVALSVITPTKEQKPRTPLFGTDYTFK